MNLLYTSLLTTYRHKDKTYVDPLSIDLTQFKWKKGYITYIVEEQDIIRPYLISYKVYNTSIYLYLILWLNNIPSIYDLTVGVTLKMPYLDELKEYVYLNTKEK